MLKLVRIGLYALFVGVLMEVIYYTAPVNHSPLYEMIFGPSGLYSHLVTGAGIVLSMFVLLPSPRPSPARQRVRRKR